MLKKVALLSAVTLAFSLSACAEIPRSSNVEVGPELSSISENETINYSPSNPVSGQTEHEIVTGHITAGTGPQNNYEVARNFLTQTSRAQWAPSDSVLVQYGPIDVKVNADHQATVTLKVQSEVDAAGNLHNYLTPVKRTLRYTLVKDNGQWRISEAPNVTIVNKPVFDVLFTGYSVYFFDNAHQYLVPEVRWFPARAATATRLVNATMAGPSKWLSQAVRPALPTDIKLAIQAVSVEGGIARVNLSSKALSVPSQDLRYFIAQLRTTLRQLSNVSNVELLIDGNAQMLPSISFSQPTEQNPEPVALGDSALRFVNSTNNPVNGAQALVKETNATDFALSVNSRQVVLQARAGLYWAKLGQIDRILSVVDNRPNTLTPVFDTSGMVWSVGRNANASIYLLTKSGLKTTVKADWLQPFEVLSFALSPEASRVAMVIRNKGISSLVICGVVRDKSGTPLALSKPNILKPVDGTPKLATFADQTNLIVGYDSNAFAGTAIFQVGIGANVNSLGSVPSLKQLAAATDGKSIFVLTKDKKILKNSGFSWQEIASNALALHMAQ